MPRKSKINTESPSVSAKPAGLPAGASKSSRRKDGTALDPTRDSPPRTTAKDLASRSLSSFLADGSDVPSMRVRVPSRDEIEARAYEIYLRRAGAPGRPEDDWYQAERELLAEMHEELDGRHRTVQSSSGKRARRTTTSAARIERGRSSTAGDVDENLD